MSAERKQPRQRESHPITNRFQGVDSKIGYGICLALLCLTACRPEPLRLETYYLQINGLHLRIPGKYFSFPCLGVGVGEVTSCQSKYKKYGQQTPGLQVRSISLWQQDFNTLELYKDSGQGLSDILEIGIYDPQAIRRGDWFPNFAEAWTSGNRDAKSDIYGLQAYKVMSRDDVNYRHGFADGTVLLITCQSFDMPNPGCAATTNWRGLLVRYNFRHRHLVEWQDLHHRLAKHFNSFVYQP